MQPAAALHPDIRFTPLGAALRRHAATGTDAVAALARACIADAGPHDGPMDLLPLQVLRDHMLETPDHPLARQFNWERLPEQVALDRTLYDAVQAHGRTLDPALPPLDAGTVTRMRSPWPAHLDAAARVRADCHQKHPWASVSDVDAAASRVELRQGREWFHRHNPPATQDVTHDALAARAEDRTAWHRAERYARADAARHREWVRSLPVGEQADYLAQHVRSRGGFAARADARRRTGLTAAALEAAAAHAVAAGLLEAAPGGYSLPGGGRVPAARPHPSAADPAGWAAALAARHAAYLKARRAGASALPPAEAAARLAARLAPGGVPLARAARAVGLTAAAARAAVAHGTGAGLFAAESRPHPSGAGRRATWLVPPVSPAGETTPPGETAARYDAGDDTCWRRAGEGRYVSDPECAEARKVTRYARDYSDRLTALLPARRRGEVPDYAWDDAVSPDGDFADDPRTHVLRRPHMSDADRARAGYTQWPPPGDDTPPLLELPLGRDDESPEHGWLTVEPHPRYWRSGGGFIAMHPLVHVYDPDGRRVHTATMSHADLRHMADRLPDDDRHVLHAYLDAHWPEPPPPLPGRYARLPQTPANPEKFDHEGFADALEDRGDRGAADVVRRHLDAARGASPNSLYNPHAGPLPPLDYTSPVFLPGTGDAIRSRPDDPFVTAGLPGAAVWSDADPVVHLTVHRHLPFDPARPGRYRGAYHGYTAAYDLADAHRLLGEMPGVAGAAEARAAVERRYWHLLGVDPPAQLRRRRGRIARLARAALAAVRYAADPRDFRPLAAAFHEADRRLIESGYDGRHLPALHAHAGILADRLDDDGDPRGLIVRRDAHGYAPGNWDRIAGEVQSEAMGRAEPVHETHAALHVPGPGHDAVDLPDGTRLAVHAVWTRREGDDPDPVADVEWRVPHGLPDDLRPHARFRAMLTADELRDAARRLSPEAAALADRVLADGADRVSGRRGEEATA